MKTIALRIIGLIFCATVAWIGLSAQEPVKKVDLSIDVLKDQVTQLQQQVAQKDAQISQMQANIVASQKMFGACFQSLAEAEQRAAQKK